MNFEKFVERFTNFGTSLEAQGRWKVDFDNYKWSVCFIEKLT